MHEINKAIAWQLGHLSESEKYQVSSGKPGTSCGYLLIMSTGQKEGDLWLGLEKKDLLSASLGGNFQLGNPSRKMCISPLGRQHLCHTSLLSISQGFLLESPPSWLLAFPAPCLAEVRAGQMRPQALREGRAVQRH